MLFISFVVSYSVLLTMGCHFQTPIYMLCSVRSSDRFSNPHIDHNENDDLNNDCYRQTHTYTYIYSYIVVAETFCTKSDQFDKPFSGTKTLLQLVFLTSKNYTNYRQCNQTAASSSVLSHGLAGHLLHRSCST